MYLLPSHQVRGSVYHSTAVATTTTTTNGTTTMNVKSVFAATLAAGAIGAALSGLAAGPANAEPTTTAELTFVSVLDKQGIRYTSEDAAVTAGHSVCTLLDDGFTPMRVARVVGNTTSMTDYNAGYFVGASIGAFCPRYAAGL